MNKAFTVMAVLVCLFTASTHCSRNIDVPAGARLAELPGRCVVLLSPVAAVRTADNEVGGYLTRNTSSPNAVVLAAGSKIIIDRVLLTTSVDDRGAIVLGHVAGSNAPARCSLFVLFDSAWLQAAEKEAFGERAKDAPQLSAPQLSNLARWCEH